VHRPAEGPQSFQLAAGQRVLVSARVGAKPQGASQAEAEAARGRGTLRGASQAEAGAALGLGTLQEASRPEVEATQARVTRLVVGPGEGKDLRLYPLAVLVGKQAVRTLVVDLAAAEGAQG